MDGKIQIALIFGGRSHEHRVSLLSALQVTLALEKEFSLVMIGIDQQGDWFRYPKDSCFENSGDPEKISLSGLGDPINPLEVLRTVDVVFPLMHGPLGEDGAVQGLCKMANIPFIGADVLGSSVGMDKEVMKRLLLEAKIPTAPYTFVRKGQETLAEPPSYPCFVKPCNGGSSFGITKVVQENQLLKALEYAFLFDEKVILEQAIEGREIHVGVIGDNELQVSQGCEIRPKGEYHSYSSKYIDPEGAEFIYPAPIEMGLYLKLRKIAIRAYQALEIKPMARIDLFLTNSGEVFVNEVNTIPGLTKTSPFAKMWTISGVPFVNLVQRQIDYALKRHKQQSALYNLAKVSK